MSNLSKHVTQDDDVAEKKKYEIPVLPTPLVAVGSDNNRVPNKIIIQ